ncbi:hypothetical protein DFJ73DRAFT_332616 [Zopfochytrium polystomum]|nr:hypothetical protein DFJ73DRAFT_332616 [Zopfochytrium polystomum]
MIRETRRRFALALLILEICISFLPTSAAPTPPSGVATYCDDDRIFCACAQRDQASGLITFVLQSSSFGWVAMGLGSERMSGATILVGWTSGSKAILSQRNGIGHVPPTVADAASNVFANVSSTIPDWCNKLSSASAPALVVAFSLASPGSLISATQPTQFIWASNNDAPSDPANPSSAISMHQSFGFFTFDLTKSASASASSSVASLSVAPPSSANGTKTSDGNAQSTTSTQTLSALAGAAAPTGVVASSFCDGSGLYCVAANLDEDKSVVTFHLQSTVSGWMGLGIGASTMAGATMYIAYADGSGSGRMMLSQRSTTRGHSIPTVATVQTATLLASNKTPPWASPLLGSKLAVTFNRSLSVNGANAISTAGPISYIWAVSSDPPSNPDSVSASIVQHSDFGSFSLDLSQVGDAASTDTTSTSSAVILDENTLQLMHGSFMFLAWAVFPAIGIFTARYLKDALGHNWYRIHVGCMVGGTLLFTALGLAAIELQVPSSSLRFIGNPEDNATSPHRPVGTAIVFGALPTQIILGYLCNALFSANRRSVPWWDQVHWWLGRGATLLAVIEVHFGLALYGASGGVIAAYWVWIGATAVAMAVGHYAYGGAVHHTGDHPSHASGSGLAASPSDHGGDGVARQPLRRESSATARDLSDDEEEQKSPVKE